MNQPLVWTINGVTDGGDVSFVDDTVHP